MTDLDKLESRAIWNVKAMALIAIVACHCCQVSENPNGLNQLTTYFFDYWISYGVPVFYFVAGYLFRTDEKGVFHFWNKKIKTIVIPWIFTGTLVWLYIVLRKGGMNWNNWCHYLFLRESYLYFLTDLIVFYALLYWIRKKEYLFKWLNVMLAICVLVAELANIELLLQNVPGKGLPVVNFLLFYIGMLSRDLKLGEKIRTWKWMGFGIPFVVIRFIQINIIKTSSGIVLNILGSMCLIIAVYSFCYKLAEKKASWICNLGKYSFPIYLLHMPAAGLISNLLNRSEQFAVLTLWRPFIVIGITYVLIKIYECLVHNRQMFLMLIGER